MIGPSEKKIIYVAGPYSAKPGRFRERPFKFSEEDQNISRARECALTIWALGAVALCPHLNSLHMGIDLEGIGIDTSELFYRGDLDLMKRCDAVYMMMDWQYSSGARLEREWATQWNMTIFYDLDSLSQWVKQ